MNNSLEGMERLNNESPKDRSSTASEPLVKSTDEPRVIQGERTHFSLDSVKSNNQISLSGYRVPLIPMPPDTDPPKKSNKESNDSTLESRLMTNELDPSVVKTLTAFARASSPMGMQQQQGLNAENSKRSTSPLILGSSLSAPEENESPAKNVPLPSSQNGTNKKKKSSCTSPLSNQVVNLHSDKKGLVGYHNTIPEEKAADESVVSDMTTESKQQALPLDDVEQDRKAKEPEPEQDVSPGSGEEAAATVAVLSAVAATATVATATAAAATTTSRTGRKKKVKKSSSSKGLDEKQDDETPISDPEKKVRKTKKSKSERVSSKTKRSKTKSDLNTSHTDSSDAVPKRHVKKHVTKQGEDEAFGKSNEDKAPVKKKKKSSHRDKHESEEQVERGHGSPIALIREDEGEGKGEEEKDDKRDRRHDMAKGEKDKASGLQGANGASPLISFSPLSEQAKSESHVDAVPFAAKGESLKAKAESKRTQSYRSSPLTAGAVSSGTKEFDSPSGVSSYQETDAFAFGGPIENDTQEPTLDSQAATEASTTEKKKTKKKKKSRCCLLVLKDKIFKGKKKDKAILPPEANEAEGETPAHTSFGSKNEGTSSAINSADTTEDTGFRLKRNKFILMPPELEDELPEDNAEHRSIQGKEEMLSNEDLYRKKSVARKLAKKRLQQQSKEEEPKASEQDGLAMATANLPMQKVKDAEKEDLRNSLVQLATKVKELEAENTTILKEKETVQVVNKKLLESLDAETGGKLKKSRSLEKLTVVEPKDTKRNSFSHAIEGVNDHLEQQSSYELEIESLRKQVQALKEENAQLVRDNCCERIDLTKKCAESQEELHAIYEFLLTAEILSIGVLKDYPDRKDRLEAIQKCTLAFRETGHYLFQFTELDEEEAPWVSIWADAYENICPSDQWMEKVLPIGQRVKDMEDDAAFHDLQLLQLIPEPLKNSLADEMAELKKREFLIELHLCQYLKNDSVLTEEQAELIKEIEQVKKTNAHYWNELKSLSDF